MTAVNFLLQHLVFFAVGVLAGVSVLLGGVLLAQKATGLAFRHLPTVRRFALAGLTAALWLYGSVKPENDGNGTNAPSPLMMVPMGMAHESAEPEQSVGYRMVGVESVAPHALFPVDNAVTCEVWRLRGAYDDCIVVSSSNWLFRTRDGFSSSLVFHADGAVGTSPTNDDLPAVYGQPLALLPEARWSRLPEADSASLFWYALTPSNSLLATWQNATVGREPSCPVTVQAEFRSSGDFEYRTSDEVTKFQVLPDFDCDGDGLVNELDPDPLTAGEDAHGTNDRWYLTACANLFEAVEAPDGREVVWREGVNTNAYYFVETVARIGPAVIAFNGDAESRLGDPAVVAMPGVTNRVPLTVGVAYSVTSEVPFEISVPIDALVRVVTNSPSRYVVERPVDVRFRRDESVTNAVAYLVDVDPPSLDGAFVWTGSVPVDGTAGGGGASPSSPSGAGCGYSERGNGFVYNCSGGCGCGGCQVAGYYVYENVWLPIAGGHCGCQPHDDDDDHDDGHREEVPDEPWEEPVPPSVSISFSEPAVIFENGYQNSPGGGFVEKRSTEVRLSIHAGGGSQGGMLSFRTQNLDCLAIRGGGGISLPSSLMLGPGEVFSYEVDCVGAGLGGEVSISGDIVGALGGNSAGSSIISMRVELRNNASTPLGTCANRHVYGVGEDVQLINVPSVGEGSPWSDDLGCVNGWLLVCPQTNDAPLGLKVAYNGVEYRPLVTIKEPEGIVVSNVTYETEICQANQPGGIALKYDMYVVPNDVSFVHLSMAEIPWAQGGYADGYYALPEKSGERYHLESQGAGRWRRINPNNFWSADEAGSHAIQGTWFAGNKTWDIPIGWKRSGNLVNTPVKIMGIYQQQFTLEASGTFRLDKHGHWVKRTISFDGNDCVNHVYLDGVLKE